MNQIEKVARAIYDADRDGVRYDADTYEPMAKAAIAKMPVQAEPVAWMYQRDDGSRDLLLDCNGEYARNLLELGATETPLYAHPPAQWQGIESAGGSDAE